MKFSSMEEDLLSLFLLSMPVPLPEGEVGVAASFCAITCLFEAVRGKYLSQNIYILHIHIIIGARLASSQYHT